MPGTEELASCFVGLVFVPTAVLAGSPRRYSCRIGSRFLVGIVLFSYGSRLYDDWHQSRLLRRATALLQEGKLSKAAQTAQELVARHPDSLPALRVLAEAAEKQNLEEAVKWREQIARLLPTDLESQLNLASAALRFGKLDVARQALNRVPSSDRDKAAFHVVAGWLARAEGNLAEQEEQFAAAVKKEPTNDLYQFNLAALQIHSRDPEKARRRMILSSDSARWLLTELARCGHC